MDDVTIFILKIHLQSKYKLKNIGDITWYLGIGISHLKNRLLLLSQKKYIYDLFVHHGIENCASTTTLMMYNLKLSKDLDKYMCNAKT